MRLVFAGTPEPAVPSLRRLLDSGTHEVVAVLTRPDARAGRGRTVSRSPVARIADAAGIPVLTPVRPSEPDFVATLRTLAPDCCPVVAYGALLPAAILHIPRNGWINLHFSLLPEWRGAAPVQAAIAAGDDNTGATTFLIEEGLDSGPVFGTVTETIRGEDTAATVLDRLADSGAGLLETTLDGVAAGTLVPLAQPADGVSYAPKVTPESARVRWDVPAFAVDRHIRSVTPVPGAWTMIGGVRIKIGPVRPVDDRLPVGRLSVSRGGVHVGTATTAVRLGQIQPRGKRMMSALDWARGARPDETTVIE